MKTSEMEMLIIDEDCNSVEELVEKYYKRINELEFEKGMLEVQVEARGASLKLNDERIAMFKQRIKELESDKIRQECYHEAIVNENKKLERKLEIAIDNSVKYCDIVKKLQVKAEDYK